MAKEYSHLLGELAHAKAIHHYANTHTQDRREISIFAIDLGKCLQEGILFGRPPEARTNQYFNQPQFDLTNLLKDDAARATAAATPIIADRPTFGIRGEPLLGMPNDRSITHQRILDAIYEAGPRVGLLAKQIAGAIDLSPALVGKAAVELDRQGLIVREKLGAVYSYRLSEKGRAEFLQYLSASQ